MEDILLIIRGIATHLTLMLFNVDFTTKLAIRGVDLIKKLELHHSL
jgi:hypothetical protein